MKVVVEISNGFVINSFRGSVEDCLKTAERWLENPTPFDIQQLRIALLEYKVWKKNHYHPDNVIQIIEPIGG